MYISVIFSSKKQVLSFEIFPPKQESGIGTVKSTVDELVKQPIDYISVTYGAGGSTSKKTADIAEYIQNQHNMTALAHLSCITSRKDEIKDILNDLDKRGIKNILALRGDLPQDGNAVMTDYQYASEVVSDIKKHGDFCVGGAC